MDDMSTTALTVDTSSLRDQNTESTISLEFKVRNVIVGAIGILANLIAFCVVLKSGKVKGGRKLLLLNLIVSDIALLAVLMIYGIETSTQISGGIGCMLIIFMLTVSVHSSYLTCFVLSCMNFMAVHKPFEFSRLVSLKNSSVSVLVCWLLAIGCSYLWIGNDWPTGLTCAPVILITGFGLAGYSVVLFATSFGIFGLNAAVIYKMKTKFRFSSDTNNAPQQNQAECRRNGLDTPGKNLSVSSLQEIPPSSSDIAGQSLEVSDGIVTAKHEMDRKISGKPLSTLVVYKHRHPASKEDRLCKVLIILISFSCTITLPAAIYLICIITGVVEDLEKSVSSPLGIFFSSCPMIKACINPFFYVLNFVNWQMACKCLLPSRPT